MTGQEAKDKVYAGGMTLRQWADAKGFDYQIVSRVVRGVQRANYGKGHDVAVALGMKKKSEGSAK